MSSRQFPGIVIAFVLMTTAGVSLQWAESNGRLAHIRTTAHDWLTPGRLMLASLIQMDSAGDLRSSAQHDNTSEIESLREKVRRLTAENAQLVRQVALSTSAPPFAQSESDAGLLKARGVSARVLSRSGMDDRLTELLIDAGRKQNIRTAQLVVKQAGMITDAGAVQGVQAGDSVVSGQTVIGRIIESGHYVSVVQPITAEGFAAGARLIRQTPDGPRSGSAGMLEGFGNATCRLTGIPYTEPVAAGDEVFSPPLPQLGGISLYFGRVVSAEFLDGGRWEIIVQPAVLSEQSDVVTVLTSQVRQDQVRTASHSVNSTEEGTP